MSKAAETPNIVVAPTGAERMERRTAPRQSFEGCVKLRLGHEVSVVNASREGVLIEGAVRLQPGTRIEIQAGTSPGYLQAHIARCEVSKLREDGVTYRAGLRFIKPTSYWLLQEALENA